MNVQLYRALLVVLAISSITCVGLAKTASKRTTVTNVRSTALPRSRLAAPPSCPPPTILSGGICILVANVAITRPLVLTSDTVLDCMGRSISPHTTIRPQVGIFINAVRSVRIRRCNIVGFDFGIFAINSKQQPLPSPQPFSSIHIERNIITSRYTSITLASVDDAEIVRNRIAYTSAAGRAIYIGRDSDRNKVLDNRITANLPNAGPHSAFRAPGPPSMANPEVTIPGAAILITQVEGPEPSLINAVIGNDLFQLTTTRSPTPNGEFSEGNLVADNQLFFSGVPVDGVALAVPQGTHVLNNRIHSGSNLGIRAGIQTGSRAFPNVCSLDTRRLCLEDAGCKIRGVDAVSKGTCQPATSLPVLWVTRNTLIEGNNIAGPVNTGIATTGERTEIKSNDIAGPQRDPKGGAGIRLVGKYGIETSTVMRNIVRMTVPLALVQRTPGASGVIASSFGAQVSLNDFISDERTVVVLKETNVSASYDLQSELSVNGRGNFWGTPCGVGLRNVVNIDGIPTDLVTDSHPFAIQVARTPLGTLSAPCPTPQ